MSFESGINFICVQTYLLKENFHPNRSFLSLQRRCARVVEWVALEMRSMGNCTRGSNPFISAPLSDAKDGFLGRGRTMFVSFSKACPLFFFVSNHAFLVNYRSPSEVLRDS
jgi:hypothetical protein